ncbi:hypothetical protein ACFXBB_29450 [Streptomyces scopuliridis]|uniref:hypothetical protein n=1 Tax=Streptomyces scopuliridis TaxID=452529 RepID=UPI00367E2D37
MSEQLSDKRERQGTDAPDSLAPPEVGSLVLDTSMGRMAEFRGVAATGLWRLCSVLGEDEREVKAEAVLLTELDDPARRVSAVEHPPECDECHEWLWAERFATDDDELSEAADCRIFLRRHQAAKHGAPQ